MPIIPDPDLVSSPRQRSPFPPLLSVRQVAELLGWSRQKALRWLETHEQASGLRLVRAGPRQAVYVPLSAFKHVFSDVWESILDSRALNDSAQHP